jgi:superfamily II DNA helicase RecQ
MVKTHFYNAHWWGKSICFQLPALLFSGINSDIPLIALMKDQVDSLKANGMLPATSIVVKVLKSNLTFKI